jgi:hypothetical protein
MNNSEEKTIETKHSSLSEEEIDEIEKHLEELLESGPLYGGIKWDHKKKRWKKANFK